MESNMIALRNLSPRNHDRIVDLLQKESYDQSLVIKAIPILQMIYNYSFINMDGARLRFETFLTNVETIVLKTNGFNMLIRNIPSFAQLSETDEQVAIKYVHIRDTLRQFGTLTMFHMIRGTVYVKFSKNDTCLRTHSTINNMMMGTNILKTEVLC